MRQIRKRPVVLVIGICILLFPLLLLAQATDTDQDGVPDQLDQCPTAPGSPNNSGCPFIIDPNITIDLDADDDGIPNQSDQCPSEPGPRSNNGCPVTVPDTDSDGDGVPDSQDSCPQQHHNGAIFDGCPDSDGDGLVDSIDLCPREFGPAEPPSQGCPASAPVVPVDPVIITPAPVSPVPLVPLPADDGGQCIIATSTGQAVNIRAAADINADIIGSMNPSQTYVVTGVQHDASNQPWYGLEIGGFVASWVVRASASCATVGEAADSSAEPILLAFDFPSLEAALAACPERIAEFQSLPLPILNWLLSQPDPCSAGVQTLQDTIFGLPPITVDFAPDVLSGLINDCPNELLDSLPLLGMFRTFDVSGYAGLMGDINSEGCASPGLSIDDFVTPDLWIGHLACHPTPEPDPNHFEWEGDLCLRITANVENPTAGSATISYVTRVIHQEWVEVTFWQCILGHESYFEPHVLGDFAYDPMILPPGEAATYDDRVLVDLPLASYSGEDRLSIGTIQLGDPVVYHSFTVERLPASECLVGADDLAAEPTFTPTPPIIVIEASDTPMGFAILPSDTPMGFGIEPSDTPPVLVIEPSNTPTAVVEPSDTPTPMGEGIEPSPTATLTMIPTDTATAVPDEPEPTATSTLFAPTFTPTADGGTPADLLTALPDVGALPPPSGLVPGAPNVGMLAVFEVHDGTTPNSDLYILHNRRIDSLIISETERETNPAVDGKALRVAFIRTTGDGTASLNLFDMTTRTNVMLLPSDPAFTVLPYDPAWMPDDETLVISLRDNTSGVSGLYTLPVDGVQSATPTLLVADAVSPSIALNNRYVAYLRSVNGADQLFTMALDSRREQAMSNPTRVSGCQSPAFDVNPLRIYFVCASTEVSELFRYDVAGVASIVTSPPGAIFNPEPGPLENFLLTDDGESIWFGTGDGQLAPIIQFFDGRQARNISLPALNGLVMP